MNKMNLFSRMISSARSKQELKQAGLFIAKKAGKEDLAVLREAYSSKWASFNKGLLRSTPVVEAIKETGDCQLCLGTGVLTHPDVAKLSGRGQCPVCADSECGVA